MNTVDGRGFSFKQVASYRLICCQHEFFDQFMRFVVWGLDYFFYLARGVDVNFQFRDLEIDTAVFKSLLSQQKSPTSPAAAPAAASAAAPA